MNENIETKRRDWILDMHLYTCSSSEGGGDIYKGFEFTGLRLDVFFLIDLKEDTTEFPRPSKSFRISHVAPKWLPNPDLQQETLRLIIWSEMSSNAKTLLISSKVVRSIDSFMCQGCFGFWKTSTGSFDCSLLVCVYILSWLNAVNAHVLMHTWAAVHQQHIAEQGALGFSFLIYNTVLVYFSYWHACPYFGLTSLFLLCYYFHLSLLA